MQLKLINAKTISSQMMHQIKIWQKTNIKHKLQLVRNIIYLIVYQYTIKPKCTNTVMARERLKMFFYIDEI